MAQPALKRYEMRLADICEALHMAHRGSNDSLPPDVEHRYIAHLRQRLEDWRAEPRNASGYDAAYKLLVIATLAERGAL